MTASVFEDDRQECIQVGMCDFVDKPVIPAQFYAAILEWLSRSQGGGSDGDAHPARDKTPESLPEPLPEALSGLAAIRQLDLAHGLALAHGSPESYVRTLLLFLNSHAGDAETLRQCLDAHRLNDLRPLTHALKGSAGNIGALALQRAAEAVLAALRTGAETDLLTRETQCLMNELNTLNAALSRVQASARQDTCRNDAVSPAGPDLSRAADVLKELTELLQTGSFRVNELVRREEGLLHAALGDAGPAILAHITAFDYERALLALQDSGKAVRSQ